MRRLPIAALRRAPRRALGALALRLAAAAPAAEYIVRLADGSVVSVVAPGPPTLRRGARVRVLRHPARLVPASR